jgi:hypothetical protein
MTALARALPVLLAFHLAGTARAEDPAPPGVPDAQRDMVRRTYHVLVRGAEVFLASTVGVVSANIKAPKQPSYLGALPLRGSVSQTAWVAGKLVAANGPDGIVVLDADDPAKPRKLAALKLAGAAMGVAGHDKLALVASGTAGLQVVSLEDPSRPRKVAHVETPGYARGVHVRDGNVFLADGPGGVRIYAIKGHKPSHLSTLPTKGHAHHATLTPDGKTLLVAEGPAGVALVDLGDPAKPAVVGRLKVRDAAHHVVVTADGERAVVADGTRGVAVLSISDVTNPREVGRYAPQRSVNSVTLSGALVLVANDYDGLLILKLQAASDDPSFVGSLPPRAKD